MKCRIMLYWLMLSILIIPGGTPVATKKITVIYSTPEMYSGEPVVAYQKKRNLQLGDFLQTPPEGHPALAITTSGILFQVNARKLNEETEIQIRISCLFYPQRSWIKQNGLNPTTLNHEQRHFDLSFVACNYFLKAVKNQDLDITDFKSRLNELFQYYDGWLKGMQQQYDQETAHGLNNQEQQRWNLQIDQMLRKIN